MSSDPINFWERVESFTGSISLIVLTVFEVSKFNTFVAFKKVMNDESFEKLFTSLEKCVQKLPKRAEYIARFQSHEEELKNFKLTPGEKYEIIGIFQILANVSIEDFRAEDDIKKFLRGLEKKIRQNPSIMDTIRNLDNPPDEIFNKLLNETSLNFERGSTNNRYSDVMKKFCSYLYIKIGRSAYKFLELNSTIPSVKTCLRTIHEKYEGLQVGSIYAKELKSFLDRNQLKKQVCISEDATRIKASLKYDTNLNELIGCVLPYSLSGLPNHNDQKIQTPEDVMKLMKKYPLANFVEIIIAKPLCNGPSFVLGIFPTNNDFSALEVEQRWKKIHEELKKEDIEVVCFSTDGAPSFVSAMKLIVNFGKKIYKYVTMEFLYDINCGVQCAQDIIHLLNKLKMQLMDDTYELWIGNSLATGKHLKVLVESNEYSKNDHCLLASDVTSRDVTKDKMDFDSTTRICDQKVIDILSKNPEAAGTVEYLKVMRMLIDAFLIETTSPKERIYKAFYALLFMRMWRVDLETKGKSKEKCFISKNCWDSIEITIPFLANLAKRGLTNAIIHCCSQPCESFFRHLRSISTSCLTQINFTLYECIKKVEKIQAMEIFSFELKGFGVKFPEKFKPLQSESLSSLDSVIDEDEIILEDEKWTDDMLSIVYNEAKAEVEKNLSKFGVGNNSIDLLKFFGAPNRDLLQKNQVAKYNKRDFNIEPIEIEILPFEDGNLIGNYVVFKNQKILNEISTNGKFKFLHNNKHEEFPISRFIFIIQDDVEKVSADRLMRFQSNTFNEWQPTPLNNFKIISRDSISIGELILANYQGCDKTMLGVVIKLRYKKQSSSKAQKFHFSTLKFDLNTDVEYLLYPCFFLSEDGSLVLNEGWKTYLEIENYVYTVNRKFVDFSKFEISNELIEELSSIE